MQHGGEVINGFRFGAAAYLTDMSGIPAATIVSIGHRSTLTAFHKRRLALEIHEGAPATIAG